ncbi:hypothetical protein KA078_03410 [Candidatus Woesebacteria bacterium]|nr:hypothetical protein [Candidatus Woesebacteria bacterium]
MFRKVIFIIAAVLLLLGGYWWYTHREFSFPTAFSVPKQFSGQIIPQNAEKSVQELTVRAQNAMNQAGTILGTAVQQSSESGSIQEKAFEYGRYLYCQQVIKDYESKIKE